MPVPARPHLIVIASAAVSSLVVRKFAPIGKSSSSRSPSANGPWQSAHPAVFHSTKPALTLSLFCASAIVEHARAAAARTRMAALAPCARLRSPIATGFTSAAISVSDEWWPQQPTAWGELRRQLVIVVAPIGFISVIKQTFLLCDLALANYARLKVGHNVVDFLGAELARSWVEVSTATRAPRCAFLKGRHSSARASAADCELEFVGIEPCPPQIGSRWRFIAFLFPVREGAMTISTPAVPPRGNARFHFVFILRERGG